MKHLFIINPAAKKAKGRVGAIQDDIHDFFRLHPELRYDMYVSQWCRDAMAYIRLYIMENHSSPADTVRVHVIGGTGTLFEAANGIAGLPNVELAAHPYGRADTFLQYFGNDKIPSFANLENQVFGKTVPMDLIRCRDSYGLCYVITGLEAVGNAMGDRWIARGYPADLSYVGACILQILKDKTVGQRYYINIDGTELQGDFASILIANAPCYGDNMYPAIDAHPDDGFFDVYIFKSTSKLETITGISQYTSGKYHKLPHLVTHHRANKVQLSSDATMCMSVDGEIFYGMSADYELIPGAIRFVCPDDIDLQSLPLLYKRPDSGPRG